MRNAIVVVQNDQSLENKVMHGDASIDQDGNVTVTGGGGSSISGLSNGFIPLANGATSLNRNSPIDYGVTELSTVTIPPVVHIGPPESTLPAVLQGYTEPQILITGSDFPNSIGTEALFTDQDSAVEHYLAGVLKDTVINNGSLTGFEADLYTDVDSTNDFAHVLGAYFYIEHDAPGILNEAAGLVIESVAKGGGAGAITTVLGIEVNDQTVGATNYAIKTGKGVVQFGDVVRSGVVYSVAGTALPSASSVGVSARAFVSDAVASTFNAAYVGGGANKVPVFSDGTVWRIG